MPNIALTTRLLGSSIYRVLYRFRKENFSEISGSLAFTTLLALVPIAALLFAAVSVLPLFSALVGHIENFLVLHLLPESSAKLIAGKLLQYSQRASSLTWLGFLVLAITAFPLLHTVESAFNRVWHIKKRRPFWQRLRLYLVVLLVWPLIPGTLLATTSYAITASLGVVHPPLWLQAIFLKSVSLLTLVLCFTVLYRQIPNTCISWKQAALSGGIASAGLSCLQKGFEIYLAHFPSYTTIYGTFSAVPIFLMWIYSSWAIILFAALVAATPADLSRIKP